MNRGWCMFVGAFGSLASVPTAIFGYMMHKGFGGTLTMMDTLVLLSPFVTLSLLLYGMFGHDKND